MDKLVPVIRALVPFAVAALSAAGVSISPEIQATVEENLVAVLLAIGALAAAFPSIKAALKFGEDAK
jgi:hypothetical protein